MASCSTKLKTCVVDFRSNSKKVINTTSEKVKNFSKLSCNCFKEYQLSEILQSKCSFQKVPLVRNFSKLSCSCFKEYQLSEILQLKCPFQKGAFQVFSKTAAISRSAFLWKQLCLISNPRIICFPSAGAPP